MHSFSQSGDWHGDWHWAHQGPWLRVCAAQCGGRRGSGLEVPMEKGRADSEGTTRLSWCWMRPKTRIECEFNFIPTFFYFSGLVVFFLKARASSSCSFLGDSWVLSADPRRDYRRFDSLLFGRCRIRQDLNWVLHARRDWGARATHEAHSRYDSLEELRIRVEFAIASGVDRFF